MTGSRPTSRTTTCRSSCGTRARSSGLSPRHPGWPTPNGSGSTGCRPRCPRRSGRSRRTRQLVDAERIMRQLRAVKLPAEIECVQMAISMTEGALAAIRDEVRPGVTEQELKGRFHEELSRFGINHPAMEGTFCATPRDDDRRPDGSPPLRLLPDGRPLSAGDLVAVAGSVPYAAYEGVVARTWACVGPTGRPSDAHRSLGARGHAAIDAVVDRCRPGVTGGELLRTWSRDRRAARSRPARPRRRPRRGVPGDRRSRCPSTYRGAAAVRDGPRRAGLRLGAWHRRLPRRGDRPRHRRFPRLLTRLSRDLLPGH